MKSHIINMAKSNSRTDNNSTTYMTGEDAVSQSTYVIRDV
jgi:hypothetical protein